MRVSVDGNRGYLDHADDNEYRRRTSAACPDAIYGIGAVADMAWPRSPKDPSYSNYAMIVTTAGVLLFGIYMVFARPYDRGSAPAGDAHRLQVRISLSVD